MYYLQVLLLPTYEYLTCHAYRSHIPVHTAFFFTLGVISVFFSNTYYDYDFISNLAGSLVLGSC
jgi:hypothetical protein